MNTQLKQNHVAITHKISFNEGFFGTGHQSRFVVNSFHEHGVEIDQLASSLKSIAVSDDNIIEGLIHPNLPIIAIQWHPERKSPSKQLDHKLFSKWWWNIFKYT